jgi:shikimate kinase
MKKNKPYPMRIYLIGMPGSGKTTFGQQLADRLRYSFGDTDNWIEQMEQMPVSEVFQEEGEKYFRLLEQQILLQTLDYKRIVISCGGGMPCFFENMALIKQKGFSIFLNTPLPVLAKRILQQGGNRPLLTGTDEETLLAQLNEIWTQRSSFYQQADLVIDGDNPQTDEVIRYLTYA